MANRYDKLIVGEGWRGAEVRLTGVIDTVDIALMPAIALADFTNNDDRCVFWGLRVDCIQYSIGENLRVTLEWNAVAPQLLAALAGYGKQNYYYSGGLVPTRPNPGYDGGINLRTSGFAPGTVQNFTLMLSFTKLYTP